LRYRNDDHKGLDAVLKLQNVPPKTIPISEGAYHFHRDVSISLKGRGYDEWLIVDGTDRPTALPPNQLGYDTFFYNGCESIPDYIQEFQYGTFIGSRYDYIIGRDTGVVSFTNYIYLSSLVSGFSLQQTLNAINAEQRSLGDTEDGVFEFVKDF
jgi:hypothetical protein